MDHEKIGTDAYDAGYSLGNLRAELLAKIITGDYSEADADAIIRQFAHCMAND